MSFWLEKGIAGFRMDVINLISKTPDLPNASVTDPKEEYQNGSMYFANGPRLHEFLQEMRREVLDKFDTIAVGEMPFVTDPQEVLRCVKGRKELDMVFQFDMFVSPRSIISSHLHRSCADSGFFRLVALRWTPRQGRASFTRIGGSSRTSRPS